MENLGKGRLGAMTASKDPSRKKSKEDQQDEVPFWHSHQLTAVIGRLALCAPIDETIKVQNVSGY